MRCFVALGLPAAVRADVERFVEPRIEATPEWRWTPAANYHVTLGFLGDVDDRHVERVEEALGDVARRSAPLRLRLDGAGGFPSVAATKHLYLAVRDLGGGLPALAERVRLGCAHAGCTVDGAAFVPHVSVARTRTKRDATKLWRALDTYASAAWDAGEFALYRSELGQGPGGAPRYSVERAFPLDGASGA